ncbi:MULTISPECIES: carboxynorspermidine decarboxylase [unclassified Paenibacillus]|uniref:carboxynorspermidine decarboxylase n=1 Tax=unclassified Paenibacillus TaxID=185978 RepID=UPI002406A9FC|nr:MULTISPECIES: carboxynorspermidine decarboxylase [unclassified Paenibacillus]MDF9842266.1 carboxynorspermidine decarboxylase [Paenibacillus sp. PastF-2]MDF9848857.1 carboxynorspermidine decarboxylase [Paenibacillus sp. PastM-2]MDF9855427.1 carboxynorspermidine decarboxylase [Paenibacillus sp. PastF-1]MDH6480697.1 carboxynorspermidine decarboxylase [Paenibacillus sp. PastH-2]MDH6508122.1 carboxynorspermidine decarboxylase [Paenibacillus sp. PastM-3]
MKEIDIDISSLPSPAYLVDERLLKKNLETLNYVQERTGAKILLAQKGFSMHALYPLVGKYLHGVTSSSLFEARLGFEEMGKEVHVYAPAYMEREFDELLGYTDHIVFNSFDQWNRFKDRVQNAGKPISCGIRVNPEYSEIEVPLYDPCYNYSRMGVTLPNFRPEELDGIEGLHFHTMCEQNSDTLERTLKVVEEKFGQYLHGMKWLNFGGGHHITRDDYDLETLIKCILHMKETYNVQIYLEPGEAVALNTGYLVATVLDTMRNGMDIAILDTSAECHMPDVLAMPYRPNIIGSGQPGEYPYTYRLGGMTCLAGDVIGDYSFPEPLKYGDKLVFLDMAIYSMVKNHMFNGVNLPAIASYNDEEGLKIIREFEYSDFSRRLS